MPDKPNENNEARMWSQAQFQGETIARLDGLGTRTTNIEEHLIRQNGSICKLEKLTTQHKSNWIWLMRICMFLLAPGGLAGLIIAITKILKLW